MADELDQLYDATPEEFTALRTELAAAARKRGDSAAAKQISTARKPTTAAWVVNRLVNVPKAVARLRDLGSRLRAAHATMSGERIRELTAEQRKLVDELTKAALASAGVTYPTSALRDDVHGTLQAAVADPEVTARIGRLTKAERWSGFAEFGDVTVVSTGSKSAVKAAPVREKPERSAADRRAERDAAKAKAEEQVRADVAAAERAKAAAQEVLDDTRSRVESARQLREEARKALHKADRDLAAAESDADDAAQAVDAAAKAVREARSRLKRR